MRKLVLFLFVALMAKAFVSAQGDFPPQSEPGKCYAKCLIQDEYTTTTEKVLIKAASTRVEIVPAIYETVKERFVAKEAGKQIVGLSGAATAPASSATLLQSKDMQYEVKQASKRFEVVSAVYETVTDRVMIKEPSKKIVYVPAVYETVKERVMIRPEVKRFVTIPAVYETVTERIVTKEATTRMERVPAQYETTAERMEIAPASNRWEKRVGDRNCLSANPEDCAVWCLVEVPAEYRVVNKQVRKECAAGFTANGDDCVRTIEIPAEYRTVSRSVIKTPASVREETTPAEYREVTKQVVKTPATTREEEVPAEYQTVTIRKVKTPATVREVEEPAQLATLKVQRYAEGDGMSAASIDAKSFTKETEGAAQYEEYTKQIVKTPTTTRSIDIPAEYTDITKKTLVKKGGMTEWREVLCDNKVSSYTMRQIQEALRARGYDPGPTDNMMGVQTKAALVKFQKDKGLPIGSLDLETLKALGIKF